MRPHRLGTTAVSEVIGTVLLLSITIIAFAGVALAVQARLETNPPPPNARFDLLHEGPNMTIVHRWGESVDVTEMRMIFENDSGRLNVEMGPVPALEEAPGGRPGMWDLSEDLQVVCRPIDSCLGPGQGGSELFLIHDPSQTVLFHQA
jgi:hypothetical protein